VEEKETWIDRGEEILWVVLDESDELGEWGRVWRLRRGVEIGKMEGGGGADEIYERFAGGF